MNKLLFCMFIWVMVSMLGCSTLKTRKDIFRQNAQEMIGRDAAVLNRADPIEVVKGEGDILIYLFNDGGCESRCYVNTRTNRITDWTYDSNNDNCAVDSLFGNPW